MSFGEPRYGMTRNVGKTTLEALRPKVEEALKAEGFGILTEINVSAILKKKINADIRPYLILGACNPTLAHQAIAAEPAIGLLLPCNVVLAMNEDGTATVSFLDPKEMFKITGRSDIEPLAAEVRSKLSRALDSITL